MITDTDIDVLETLRDEAWSSGWCGVEDFRFDSLQHRHEWTASLFWLRERGYVESRVYDQLAYENNYQDLLDLKNSTRDDLIRCSCSLVPGPHFHVADDFEWRITEAGRQALADAA